MKDFDSDFRKLPCVPFIVELETFCFIVELRLCRGQQHEFQEHFTHISAPKLKPPILLKANRFESTCETFILHGNDGYMVEFEPDSDEDGEAWFIDRPIILEDPAITKYFELAGVEPESDFSIDCLLSSLDEIPAYGYEAWAAWSYRRDYSLSSLWLNVVNLLESGEISIDYLKKNYPEFLDFALNSKVYPKEMTSILKDILAESITKKGKKKSRKREVLQDVNQFETVNYFKNQAPTKDEAIRKTIDIFYTEQKAKGDQCFIANKIEALSKKIKRRKGTL